MISLLKKKKKQNYLLLQAVTQHLTISDCEDPEHVLFSRDLKGDINPNLNISYYYVCMLLLNHFKQTDHFKRKYVTFTCIQKSL